jgi:hypothetical protein
VDGEAGGNRRNCSWRILNPLVLRNTEIKALVKCRSHRMHWLQVFGNLYTTLRDKDPNMAWLVI